MSYVHNGFTFAEDGSLQVVGSGSAIQPASLVAMIGDSNAEHDLDATARAAGYAWPGSFTDRGILMWAHVLSGGKLRFGNTYGASGTFVGDTIAQADSAIASGAKTCVIISGTNDAGQVAFATTVANYTAVIQKLLAAGVLPVLCTLMPRIDRTDVTANDKINRWLTQTAAVMGLPLVDFYSALSAPTNGAWAAGVNTDTLHVNSAGAKIAGQLLATTLQPVVAPTPPPLLVSQGTTDTSVLLANGLFQNGAGTPTGWTTAGAPTVALAPDATVGLGNIWTVTRTGGVDATFRPNAFPQLAVTADHRILIGCKLKATVPAGGVFSMKIQEQVGGSSRFMFALNSWTKDVPAGSAVAQEFVVPTGVTGVTVFFELKTVDGVSASIGQFTAVDLTAAGLA